MLLRASSTAIPFAKGRNTKKYKVVQFVVIIRNQKTSRNNVAQ